MKNELSATEQADLENGEPSVPRSIQAEAGSPLPEGPEQTPRLKEAQLSRCPAPLITLHANCLEPTG